MTTLILAEKPSQAKAYADAMQSSTKKPGYIAINDLLFTDETVITYGFGHLVGLAMPDAYGEQYAKWDLDNLPIIPEQMKFVVGKDKKKQFNIVKQLIQTADTIIIATDCDREGENIAWSILKQTKVKLESKTIKRLWINSLEKDVIRKGFTELQDAYSHYDEYLEAQTREISDWLVGMNGSPLFSVLLQKAGLQGSYSIGRVQTPTLYMIYQRQLEIENFVSKPYWQLEAMIQHANGAFKAKLHPIQDFNQNKDANESLAKHGIDLTNPTPSIIESVETNRKGTMSPHLFALSTLQTKANNLFKASASETLAAVQTLYEQKLLTYPRTDCNYITEAEYSYLAANLEAYFNLVGIKPATLNKEPLKRYVDGSKVQEHHAIVPTKTVATRDQLEKMDPLAAKIYNLVLRQTLGMFLPPYVYDETIVMVNANNLMFKASGKVELDQGWKIVFPQSSKDTDDDTPTLPAVNEKDRVSLLPEVVAKKTTPPKPYTEGTLIAAMKKAGQSLDKTEKAIMKEVEGIGTEATRAGIIDRLKEKNYIQVKKNKLIVTSQGGLLCEAASVNPLLVSPKLTAEWETALKQVGTGQITQDKFLGNIKTFVTRLVAETPGAIQSSKQIQGRMNEVQLENVLGSCPVCQTGKIVNKGKVFGCSNYPTCEFGIYKTIAGKKLTSSLVSELITKKKTKSVSGFKSKTGKSFSAALKLTDKGVEFDFSK